MAEKIDIILPESSQEGTESVIASWLKNVGDRIELYEPILEISTDKVNVEISSTADGVLVEILKHENEQIEIGDILGRIQLVEEGSEQKEIAPIQPADKIQQITETVLSDSEFTNQETRLSPSVRRLVKQHNINVSQIKGSWKRGRISFQDVENYLETSVKDQPKEAVIDKLTDRKINQNEVTVSYEQCIYVRGLKNEDI